jgi:uncharacterized membrane protein SirB2
MYEGLRYFHMLTVVISVTLLCLRYVLMMAGSPRLNNKALKVFPHINDTFLLASGVALIFITHFIPFTPAAPWLSEKLILVVLYIVLGFIALKLGKNKAQRTVAFVAALACIAMAGKLAVLKLPMLLG